MLRIENISATSRAAAVLRAERSEIKLRRGDVFALVYMFYFTNADGSKVEGFKPGYSASSWGTEYLTDKWELAHLPDGSEFYFMPKFRWDTRKHYIIDVISERYSLFSIGPV